MTLLMKKGRKLKTSTKSQKGARLSKFPQIWSPWCAPSKKKRARALFVSYLARARQLIFGTCESM
jgi:hypothetical protein